MRKLTLVAGLAAAALIPSLASAQQTCAQQHDNRVAGTVAGAGVGAILGSALAGRDSRTAGALLGAAGGAVVGNQVTRSNADCAHAYGYYDAAGSWHANAVGRAEARGYYDREGSWVEGPPNGYYDTNRRWIASTSASTQSGYYDRQGYWVPTSASGYYDTDGRWIAGTASGHYEQGRWIAGYATGHYDSRGVWIAGAANGHRAGDGVWRADAEAGHYNSDGRWVTGASNGYYDTGGRWIPTGADRREQDWGSHGLWAGAPADIRAREDWLEQRIRSGMDDGSLSRRDARSALRSLTEIRNADLNFRRSNGELSNRERTVILAKLDALSRSVRWARDKS